MTFSEAIPLFAALLSVPLPPPRARQPARYSPLSLSPEALRHKTLESLVAWLLATAEQQAVILVMEDLHWMDPSTLELLGMLLEQAPTAPVLLLLTFREGFEPLWASRSHLMHLTLHPLISEAVGWMEESAPQERPHGIEGLGDLLRSTPDRADPMALEEYRFAAVELLANALLSSGSLDAFVNQDRIFIPKRMEE